MWNSIIDFFTTRLVKDLSSTVFVVVVYNFLLWLGFYLISSDDEEYLVTNGMNSGNRFGKGDKGISVVFLAPLWETTDPTWDVFLVVASIIQVIIYSMFVIGYILLIAGEYMKKKPEKNSPKKEESSDFVPYFDDILQSNTIKF